MKKYSYLAPHAAVLAFAVLWLLFILSAMLGHNPQGEFRDFETGKYHLDAILPILGFWAVVIFLLIEMPLILLQLISRNAARKNESWQKTVAKMAAALICLIIFIIALYRSVAVL